jgi:hypothetical protein
VLLALDCIPSGIEVFPAISGTPVDLIKKIIDGCDYYLLILGGRYGSIGPDGISYTEMEYQYALSIGKPTISFLHRNPNNITLGNAVPTDEGKEKLKAFRALVEKKHCMYWQSPQELGASITKISPPIYK